MYIFFCVFGLQPQHMEVPGLGVKKELQPPAYVTATAMPDPSCIWDLHHSSWQCQILNPLTEARDRTRYLMVPSRICFCYTMTGTPKIFLILVDLHNSVNFCCVAKWPSYTHIYILYFFSHYPPSCSITSDWISFPVLYSRTSLLICPKCNSSHLLTPNF